MKRRRFVDSYLALSGLLVSFALAGRSTAATIADVGSNWDLQMQSMTLCLEFQQQGNVLAGFLREPNTGKGIPLSGVVVSDTQVQFDVDFGSLIPVDEATRRWLLSPFTGSLVGDRMTGEAQVIIANERQTISWTATRL